MAIAAGDTPSPEMVAAAGADVGIGSAMAWRLLVLALPAILVFALLAGRTVLTTIGAPLKSPDAMIERARDLLTSAGMRGPVADSAFGFSTTAYLNYAASGKAVAGDGGLADNAVAFWYRERPVLLERARFVGPSLLAAVAPDDPPLYYSGELMVWLDRHGRLIGARSIPRQKPTVEATTSSPEWSTFFKAAGLDEATWAAADSEWTPIAYADRRWAWVPKGSQPVPAIRIEATSVRGKPISFVLVYPWTFPDRDVGTARTSERRVGDFIAVSLLSLLMLGAAVVARRNLRLDRVDRKGAVRLGLVVASLAWIAWLLDEHHVPSIWELYLATVGIGYALFVGVLVGVFYMALEPHVRRTWPSMLVSWSRLLAGDLLNPLVARDVLIGAVVIAILGSIDLGSMQLVRSLTGVLPQLDQAPRPFMGGLHLLSAFPVDLLVTIFLCLLQLFLYFVVRRVVRFDWVAIGLCGLVMALATSVGVGATAARLPLAFLVQAATFLMLSRIGLVAFIAGSFVQSILLEFPVTWPMGMWYSPAGYLGLAVSAALVIGAFRIVMRAQEKSIPARASA
jgi:serine/threonine-protein kinase